MNEPNQHKHDPCIYCGQPDSGPCLATRDTLLEGNKALLVANRKMDEALSRLRDERDAAIQRAEKAEACCAEMRGLSVEAEDLINEVAAYGSCDCDIPKGVTCIPCQCNMLAKRIAETITSSDCGKDYVKK